MRRIERASWRTLRTGSGESRSLASGIGRRMIAVAGVAMLWVSTMPVAPALGGEDLCTGEYVVALGDHLTRGVGRTGIVHELSTGDQLPPGVYDVTLVSSDNNHPDGDQPKESWLALLFSDDGEVVETGASGDLDADDDVASFSVGTVEVLATVTAVQATLELGGYSITAECAVFDVVTLYRPPETTPDNVTTDEDQSVAHDVLANDSDPDGDPLTASIVQQPSNGTAWVDDSTGEVVYQPDDDFNGDDTLLYEACDLSVCGKPETLDITVIPVPDPPVAFDDVATTAQDVAVAIEVTANDVDVDGDLDPSTVVGGDPSYGQTMVTGIGVVTYTPDPGFADADDTFTYDVCDAAGACDTATVTVTVIPNAPPVAFEDVATVLEDDAIVIDVVSNDTDPDGNLDPSTVEIVESPAAGNVGIDPNSGALTFEPKPDSIDDQTIEYRVCDTFAACSDPATVTVTVEPVNDAPSFTAEDPPVVPVNAGPVLVPKWATFTPGPDHEEGQRATYSVDVADPSLFTAQPAVDPDGTLTLSPAGFEGSSDITVVVQDDGGTANGGVDTSPPATFTIYLGNAPPPPGDDQFMTDEDTLLVASVAANDIDPNGDVLRFTLVTVPSLAKAVDLSDVGVLTYEPDDNVYGTDTLTYEACDPGGLCGEATVTIEIIEVNDRPVAQPDTGAVLEDGVVEIAVLDNDTDVDGETLRPVLGLETANLPHSEVHSLDLADLGMARVTDSGTIEYVPAADINGQETFTYHACDPRGLCDPATVTIDIYPVNDAPSFSASDPPTISPGAGGQTVVGWASFSQGPANEQSQSVSFVVTNVSDPGIFSALPAVNGSGDLTYTASGVLGSSTFIVTAIDDGGTVDGGQDTSPPQTFEISVRANQRPVGVSDSAATDAGAPVTIDVLRNDRDPDGNPLFIGAISQPQRGEVERSLGALVYTPDDGFVGVDSFTYVVCDQGSPTRCAETPTVVTISVVPNPLVDLSVEIIATEPVVVGDFVTVRVVLSNDGAATATDIAVELSIPAPLEAQGALELWRVPSLAAGGSASIEFRATSLLVGRPTVTAEVVEAAERDADSEPADGIGDDFGAVSLGFDSPDDGTVYVRVLIDGNRNESLDASDFPVPDASAFSVTAEFFTGAESFTASEGLADSRRSLTLPLAPTATAGASERVSARPSVQPALRLQSSDCDSEPRSPGSTGTVTFECGPGQYLLTFDYPQEAYRLVTPPLLPEERELVAFGGDVVVFLLQDDPTRPEFEQGISGVVRQRQDQGELVSLSDATVVATSTTDGSRYQTKTNEAGIYTLELPVDTWRVEVIGQPVDQPDIGWYVVQLREGTDGDGFDFVIVGDGSDPFTGVIRGIVWETDQADAEGARPECDDETVGVAAVVRVFAEDGSQAGSYDTDADSPCFRIPVDVPGEYRVSVETDPSVQGLVFVNPPPERTVELTEDRPSADVDFRLVAEPSGEIKSSEKGGFPWFILILVLVLIGVLLWWGTLNAPRPTPFPPPPRGPRGPYPGPQSFATADPRFFGRDNEIRRLVAMTYANRVTVLFGPSGAGKTSLLLAGYLPKLKLLDDEDDEDFDVYEVVRFRADEPRGSGGASNPFIRTALATWAGEEDIPDGMTFIQWFANRERRYDELGDPLARVLIFDQFEQMFTPYPERWEQRQEFFRGLKAYLDEKDQLDRVVISIQEAQLGELEPLLDLLDLHSRTQFRLNPLEAEEAVAALVRPLEGTGVRFAKGLPERIATDLRRVQIEDAGLGPQPLGQFVDPLRLQLVALAAWRSRGTARLIEPQEVRTWTNTEQALTDFYDEAVRRAAGDIIDEAALRRWIEVHLITSVGARSRASSEDLAGLPEAAITELELSGLIVRAHGPGGERFLLAHDRFIAPILVSNEVHRDKRLVDLSTSLLTRAAAVWVRAGRSSEYLLSGQELEDAVSLAQEHPELVRGTQRAFLEESEAAAAAGSTAS